jgi:DNA-binding winged helix-turn-helix (wHTH) protein
MHERQMRQLSIDRSSPVARSISIANPSSKEELMARVWPELTIEESSLRFHIAQLRRALGDDQGRERYVTNVPGRGYCFVAPRASPYTQHSYA